MSERDGPRSSASRDDVVYPATRWTGRVVVPFLVVASVLLFVLPDRTAALFAWGISPPLSAYLLASAYIGGIWFFARVSFARRWHRVAPGFPAVVVFAGALLVATLLNLDRFSRNLPFAVWIALYATTPLLCAGIGVVQATRRTTSPENPDVVLPAAVRKALALIGAVALCVGAAMFVAPGWAQAVWAWELTPLTAQVTAAVLSLTGVVNAGMLRDARWSSFRILFQAQLVSLLAIAASLIAGREALRWDRPTTPAFLALVASAIIVYGSTAVWAESRLRARAARAD